MTRTLLVLAAGVGVGAGAMSATQHDHGGTVRVAEVSRRDIAEKLDGKEAAATVNEVTFAPGQAAAPHRHAGPVFGYVVEGEYEHAINDEPVRTYKAGETFYEPSGSVHRVARNPSANGKTRLIAVVLHPRDAKRVTTPQPKK